MSQCGSLSYLPEINFIAGSTQYFEFAVYDEKGAPLNLNDSTISWTMSYLGQPFNPVIKKNGTVVSENIFSVNLSSSDTSNLNGRFIHQPIITDYAGKEFRPSQGIITIISRINN